MNKYNPRKDDIYRQLHNLEQAIKMDSFSLTQEEQDCLRMKIEEFKELLDEKYN